jgi:hypothetical protein
VLPKRDWYLLWADLTESSTTEKLDAAGKMAEINAKNRGAGEPVTFTADEIRETAGWDEIEQEAIPKRKKTDEEDEQSD